MAKISVIVPVYKVEKYLDQCVQSVLDQTFTDFEVWLVDDGSPDACPAMCDAWAARDGRIKVIHKKNGGLSDARNAALDVCTGKYITFVDSDDYLALDMLQTLYADALHTDADLVISQMQVIDEAGAAIPYPEPGYHLEQARFLSEEAFWDTFESAQGIDMVQVHHRLYKRDLFAEMRFPKGLIHEDNYVMTDTVRQCQIIRYLNYTGYYYRLRKNSITGSIRPIDQLDSAKCHLKRASYFRRRGWNDRAEGALMTTVKRVCMYGKQRAGSILGTERKKYRTLRKELNNEYMVLAKQKHSLPMCVRGLILHISIPLFLRYVQWRQARLTQTPK